MEPRQLLKKEGDLARYSSSGRGIQNRISPPIGNKPSRRSRRRKKRRRANKRFHTSYRPILIVPEKLPWFHLRDVRDLH
jgi:hypothetical protein